MTATRRFQWLALWHLNWYRFLAGQELADERFQWLALWHLNWYNNVLSGTPKAESFSGWLFGI